MSKLKSKDLMIGDWVCFDGDTEYTNPVQIDGISTEEACVDGDWFDVWEPIPLTAEILEKNGWMKTDSKYGSIMNIHDGALDIVWHNGSVLVKRKTVCGNEKIFDLKGVCYVHELQHILRLLNVEKEVPTRTIYFF